LFIWLRLCETDLLQMRNVRWVYVVIYIKVYLCRRAWRRRRLSHRRHSVTDLSAGMNMPSCCLESRSIEPTHCLSGPFSRLLTLSCSCLVVPVLDESFATRYLICVSVTSQRIPLSWVWLVF